MSYYFIVLNYVLMQQKYLFLSVKLSKKRVTINYYLFQLNNLHRSIQTDQVKISLILEAFN